MVQENLAEQVVETPSAPVVDIATLQVQLAERDKLIAAKEVELEQAKKGLSTTHQTLSQRDRELKTQSDLRSEIASLREDMELIAVGIVKGGQDNLEGDQQNILTELQKRKTALDQKRIQDAQALAAQEYNQKADAIYAEAKQIYGEGQEEKLENIEDLLKSGNLARAEQRIERTKKGQAMTTQKTETVDIKKAIEEGIQAELKRRGLLASDDGSPGGQYTTPQQAMSDYIAGKITSEEATKRGVNFN